MGPGLLLSEGDDWKLQRRTIAPALAPRMIPLLARHIAGAAAEAVADLRARVPGRPIDLLAAMQSLALEIAGRSMFSMEMREHGPEMRARLMRFGSNVMRVRISSTCCSPSIPTPRDFARWRFRAGWMRLVERMMQARLRPPHVDAARDLFDLLIAARDPETGAGFTRDSCATKSPR